MFLGKWLTNVYVSKIGNQQQVKEMIAPKSRLVKWWAYWSYLQKCGWKMAHKGTGNSKALPESPPEHGWQLTQAASWSSLHSLQEVPLNSFHPSSNYLLLSFVLFNFLCFPGLVTHVNFISPMHFISFLSVINLPPPLQEGLFHFKGKNYTRLCQNLMTWSNNYFYHSWSSV